MKISLTLLPTLLLAALAVALSGASAQQVLVVSQKNRAFAPRAVTIDRGDTVLFVNDDGELLHHVHSEDPRFVFDIGEQSAGTRHPVRFVASGSFEVRCGIHPRMLLRVTVR